MKRMIAAALTLLSLAGGAAMAQAWPSKPIKIVQPFAAGGGGDIVSRVLAEKLQAELGQPAGGHRHLVGIDLTGQHPQPGASRPGQRPGEGALRRRRGQRLAVRGHRGRVVGEDARVHPRPVQRHRP